MCKCEGMQREHWNNKEDQAGVLGLTSVLLIQVHEGFEVPLETLLPVAYVVQTYYESTRNGM